MLKSIGIATTGVAVKAGSAQAAPGTEQVKQSRGVQRVLSEVGNPALESVTTKKLDQTTDALLVMTHTGIGELRYIQLNDRKLGVQFQFADPSTTVNRALPKKYRALPSDVEAYLLGTNGQLHFIREASASERGQLAELTDTDSDDALMHYHSKYGAFIVEEKGDATSATDGQGSNPLVVTVDGGQKAGEFSYTPSSDYLLDEDWTASTGPDVTSFQKFVSPVKIPDDSSVSTIELPQATTESPDVTTEDQEYDCSKNWAYLCSGSLVGCIGCAGICSTSMSGVTLVACLGCVGSVCNFSIPLSCSIFLDCNT